MDLATVPAAALDAQLNTLFLAINGRLGSIQLATRNPAINEPRMLRMFKKDVATLYTNIKALNDYVNPEMAAPVAAPSPFFIHRGETAATYGDTPYKTPVKTPSSGSAATPSYTPVPYSQGSSKTPKNGNKTGKRVKKTLKKHKK
jgi:hypothetical protein